MSRVSRRAFTMMALFCGWVAGCGKGARPVTAVQKPRTMKAKAVESLRVNHASESVEFNPLIASLLVSFVFSLIKQCLLANVLKTHRAVKRSPTGPVANRLRQRIAGEFNIKHPDVEFAVVNAHTESVLKSFADSTEAELIRAYQEAQAAPPDPNEDDWNAAVVRSVNQSIVEIQESEQE